MPPSRRNQNNVTLYDSSRYNLQQEPDAASFFSLILCSIGMFMRSKLIIWFSVFFIISTLCRKRNGGSLSQYLINVVMIIFALVTNYVLVPPEIKPA